MNPVLDFGIRGACSEPEAGGDDLDAHAPNQSPVWQAARKGLERSLDRPPCRPCGMISGVMSSPRQARDLARLKSSGGLQAPVLIRINGRASGAPSMRISPLPPPPPPGRCLQREDAVIRWHRFTRRLATHGRHEVVCRADSEPGSVMTRKKAAGIEKRPETLMPPCFSKMMLGTYRKSDLKTSPTLQRRPASTVTLQRALRFQYTEALAGFPKRGRTPLRRLIHRCLKSSVDGQPSQKQTFCDRPVRVKPPVSGQPDLACPARPASAAQSGHAKEPGIVACKQI
jgi:hypothetical protein